MAAINTQMRNKCQLIETVRGVLEAELAPVKGETMSAADMDRQIEALNTETKELLEKARHGDGIAAYSAQFMTIVDQIAALKNRKSTLLATRSKNKLASQRAELVIEAMKNTSSELSDWDEKIIRQMVESVTALSKDKIRVRLQGGKEIEEQL
jgi:site-specific DNA recombinase